MAPGSSEYLVFGRDLGHYVLICAPGPSEAIARVRQNPAHRMNAIATPTQVNPHTLCDDDKCHTMWIAYNSAAAYKMRSLLSQTILSDGTIHRDADQG